MKTTLLFVIWDKTRTPLEILEPVLTETVQKIWDSVPKPQAHKETPLSEFFNVELVALSSYEDKEEQFKEQDWRVIEVAAQSGPVPCFGKKLSSIIEACLSGYESEAVYFNKNVRSSKRKQLEEKSLKLVQPAFQSVLGHIWCGTLDKFKEAFDKALNRGEGFSVAAHDCTQFYMALFDEGCADAVIEQARWDTSGVWEKLRHDIDAHVASVRAAKLSGLTKAYEERLNEALSGPVEALLHGANSETWSAIRIILSHETKLAVTGFSSDLSGFDMDEKCKEKLLAGIKDHARGVVEAKAREEAGIVLARMKHRFATLLADSTPRVRTGKEDIGAIIELARSASLKLLSVMAAVRPDDERDNIERNLSVALLDTEPDAADRSITTVDPLAFSTWEEIPSSKTLLTPVQCQSLWSQFMADTQSTVYHAVFNQAIYAQAR